MRAKPSTPPGPSRRRVAALLAPVVFLVAASVGLASPGCSSPGASPYPVAAHVPYPPVPNGGGPTLASVGVVTVAFPGDSHTSDLTAFVDWLARSDWPALASQYGVQSITHRTHVDLDAAAPTGMTDDDVQTLLASNLGDGALPSAPASGPPLVYVVFTPDGTSVTRPSGSACTANPGNGYHGMTSGHGASVPYVVVPACDPQFSAVLSEVQGMELEVARLLVDTATDPSPLDRPAYQLTDEANPWSSLGPEVGDLCWGRLVPQGPGYTLQRVWSNAAAAAGEEPCTPVPAGSVAFGVSATPSTLQTMVDGGALSFDVTGWSRAAVPDWTLQATAWVGAYAIDPSLDHDTLNNGQSATLKVTVPFAQPSGTYGAVLMRALGPEDSPVWPVAFVVR